MRFNGLVEGWLLRRYKRFLADVELASGEVVTVHCPNTGAMTGCMPAGARVWLSHSARVSRKYPHTWELVETAAGLACIHSALANRVVRDGFASGLITGFEAWPDIRTEVRYGDKSRADLLLEGPSGRVFVEVKCVTLCREGGRGVFPDAVSERARKHVRELQAIRDEATRVLLFFCVFHAGINAVSVAADIDPRYRDALAIAMAEGLEVLAWTTAISTDGLQLSRVLPFYLDQQSEHLP